MSYNFPYCCSSVVNPPDSVTAWVKINYAQAQQMAGAKFRSSVVLKQYDCAQRTTTWLASRSYRLSDAKGDALPTPAVAAPAVAHPFPDTPDFKVLQFVCALK